METEKRITFYHLVLLDKSGSMSAMRRFAVDAVNETVSSIKQRQSEKDETEDHRLTLVAFCGCTTNIIYQNEPVAEIKEFDKKEYRPCCTTPLYDAVGISVTRLSEEIGQEEAAVQVTVITDGYENASTRFSGTAVRSLIEAYKSKGWLFAYLGTDHDVERAAEEMSIDNHFNFEKSAHGFHALGLRLVKATDRWEEDMVSAINAPSESERRMRKKESNRKFKDWFKDE